MAKTNLRNRAKRFIKQLKAQNTTRHDIPKVNRLLFTKVNVHYRESDDSFYVDLNVMLNNALIKIIGTLDPDKLMDGVRIVMDKQYINQSNICNVSDFSLSKSDAPNFHKFIISYINHCGDLLDAGINELPTISIDSTYGSKTDNNFLDYVYDYES